MTEYEVCQQNTMACEQEIAKGIIGQKDVIRQVMLALLAGGNVLLEGMPGLGKTMLVRTISQVCDLSFQRIQFTPDLMPSDVTGTNIIVKEEQKSAFRFEKGPIFANLVLADEINRTSSKTQSALLEAMEERQITVDGETHPLEKPFVVVATQNNVGTAGTQLLPYAQMDRFMARLSVGYPDHDAQMALLKDRLSENPLDAVSQVLTREELLAMQAEARAVQTSDALLDYITRLTMASRDHAEIEVGVSPRGALLLCQMAKARAYLLGRDFAVSEDVQAVFEPVCAHRLIPTAKARLSGVCATDIARGLLQSVPNPDYMA